MPVKEDVPDAEAAPPGAEAAEGPVLRLARAAALRTGQGVLRPLWRAGFEALIRTLAAALLRGIPGGTAYVRGSFGFGEPVFGLSDVDMILVLPDALDAPGAARERVRARWRRVAGRAPLLGRLFTVNIYEDEGLAAAAGSTLLTYGLDETASGTRPALLAAGRKTPLHVRPGLYGATADWRRVGGPERRPPPRAPAGPDRWVPAWLELQCWWRYAFWAATTRERLRAADLCVKLVAEGARIRLWVEHGERCAGRPEALRRGLSRLPEEEGVLRLALDVHRALPEGPAPPLAAALAFLTRASSRLAERCRAELDPLGGTGVRLAWPEAHEARQGCELPLVDWRALAHPTRPDETLALTEGSPGSPADLAAAARAETEEGPRPALEAPGVLVLPTLDLVCRPLIRGVLRAIQCEATDPVSFALVAGRREARFPEAPGFAVWDMARRAAAENRVRLGLARAQGGPAGRRELGLLLCAARSAVLLAGLRGGDPELPLTIPAITAGLGARIPAARAAIEEVAGAYASGVDPGSAPTHLALLLERALGADGAGART